MLVTPAMLASRRAASLVRELVPAVLFALVSAVFFGLSALASSACADAPASSGGPYFATAAPAVQSSPSAQDAASFDGESSPEPPACAPASAPDSAAGSAPGWDGASIGATPPAGSPDADDDTGASALAADTDADVDDAAAASPLTTGLPPLPAPGELRITEVLSLPSGPEPDSEWFEIFNAAYSPRLLSGLTMIDGFLDDHVIAANPPVVAPPRAYLLLVRNAAAARVSLVPGSAILYEYGTGLAPDEGIELDAGLAGDIALWNGSTQVVDVPYGEFGHYATGMSIELLGPVWRETHPESDPRSWCSADNQWAPDSDYGTPGAPTDCP